ncbi:MAG: hypothetical protein KDC90_15720 [Ignavibacteriae bacterium]|nr:hypothetical protein [Ignavibacteriota bacterium]MCB9211109.1 hypothetical protein [Ignavibacteriales bacterium]
MKTLNKILLLIPTFMVLNCSGSGTTISLNEEMDLSKYSKVYWGITKSDSIIDFRKYNNGFAIINDSVIVETINKDSVKVFTLSTFKTIYANDGLDFYRYSVTGLLVILSFLSGYYLLHQMAD